MSTTIRYQQLSLLILCLILSGFVSAQTIIADLSGSATIGYHKLVWKVDKEMTTLRYEVETSEDDISYTKIADVNAIGNTGYSYINNNVIYERQYYRVKVVEQDNSSTYSKSIVLKNLAEKVEPLGMFPNPVVNEVLIRTKEDISQVIVTDIYGKIMYKQQPEKTQQLKIPFANLTRGVYFVQVTCGGVITVKTILKQK